MKQVNVQKSASPLEGTNVNYNHIFIIIDSFTKFVLPKLESRWNHNSGIMISWMLQPDHCPWQACGFCGDYSWSLWHFMLFFWSAKDLFLIILSGWCSSTAFSLFNSFFPSKWELNPKCKNNCSCDNSWEHFSWLASLALKKH